MASNQNPAQSLNAHLPAITPAQIIAAVQALIGTIVDLTATLSPNMRLGLAAGIALVFVGLLVVDAWIRRNRAKHLGAFLASGIPTVEEAVWQVMEALAAAREKAPAAVPVTVPQQIPPEPPQPDNGPQVTPGAPVERTGS